MSRHRRLRKRPRLLMFVVAALALIIPGLVLTGSASAEANHEVVCHMEGNGTAHAVPPSKTSAHYPKHFSDDPTDSDFMIYVTYPVTDDSWPTVKAAADAQCDAENPNNPDEIPVPTVPVIDECGPGNAVYGAVPAGNYTVVRNNDGSITLTALEGFVFPGGETSVTLPAPVDSGEACPPPPPKDACDNLDGDQPEGTDCTQPADDRETRDVKDVNCDTDTVTIQHQERTREYSWDGDSWEPGEWSEWKTVSTDTRPATDEECPDEETPPTITPCETIDGTTTVTPSNLQGFDFSETRSTGHYEFTEDGLHIWTEGSTSTDKVAGYKAVDVPLAGVGEPSLTYQNTSGVLPGYQLYLDNGHGVAGFVVGEPSAYGDNWWSNKDFGVGSGMGYTSYGTLDEYLAANPDARVKAFGFSLGSGVKGDGLLEKITFGCHEWVFKGDTPPPPQPADDRETRDVKDVNCDTDTVTIQHQERTREYSWDGDSWEPGEWSEWKTVSTDTRPATDEECPDEETPPTEAENTYEASASGCDDLQTLEGEAVITATFTNVDDESDKPAAVGVKLYDVFGELVGEKPAVSVADHSSMDYVFDGQYGGLYRADFVNEQGEVLASVDVFAESCELPPGDASVIGKCHKFTVTNGENVDGYLFYGDFDEDGPDNAKPVRVPANGEVTKRTSRTEVDGMILFENGKYFEFQDVKVKQDCGKKPPVPPTPPTPHGPKWPTVKGGGEVVNPTFDTGLAGSQEGTGGPHGLLYMLSVGLAGGIVLIGKRSRKFGRS